MEKSIRPITGTQSILLDTLRIAAALTVVISHAYNQWWYPAIHHPYSLLDTWAHAAVIVFFVLSGYVIAYTTTSNNRGPVQYAHARLTRLCSMVVPALIITGIIQLIVYFLDPVLHGMYSKTNSIPRYLGSVFFLNEIWFYASAPKINGPLWSLSFEFWYYVIFGCFFYRAGGAKAIVIPLIACLIAGPKILLMMPVWLLGCLAYRLKRPAIKESHAWIGIIGLFGAAALSVIYLPALPFTVGTKPLLIGGQFITDWITGFLVAMALFIMPVGMTSPKRILQSKNLRKLADLTFPVYILHNPLLVLWRSVFGTELQNIWQMAVAVVFVLLIAGLMGMIFNRYTNFWKVFFRWQILTARSLIAGNNRLSELFIKQENRNSVEPGVEMLQHRRSSESVLKGQD